MKSIPLYMVYFYTSINLYELYYCRLKHTDTQTFKYYSSSIYVRLHLDTISKRSDLRFTSHTNKHTNTSHHRPIYIFSIYASVINHSISGYIEFSISYSGCSACVCVCLFRKPFIPIPPLIAHFKCTKTQNILFKNGA